MNVNRTPTMEDTPAVPANILVDILHTLFAGNWIELGTSFTAVQPRDAFEAAGWHALDPGSDASAQWIAVHGNALASLASWQAGRYRPLVVSVPCGVLAPETAAPPSWMQALARNGYVFSAEDEHYAYFASADQPQLQASITRLAGKAWRTKLQASSRKHVQALRAFEQERKTSSRAKSEASAAQAQIQALQLVAVYASTSWKLTKPVRWLSGVARQPRVALRQLLEFVKGVLRTLLNMKPLPRSHAPSAQDTAPDAPPVIHPDNILGPQFKTLLINELERDLPPVSHQG
jgi:hypothetical protein